MARLKVLASGSSGNCYVLESGGERLIIECGVKFDDIMQALGYDFGNVAGVVASHRHHDHVKAKTAGRLRAMGMRIHSAESGDLTTAATDRIPFEVGGFTIMPLSVPHGDCPNFAYVIDMPGDEGRLIFATDCESFPYNIPEVNFMLVEANYDENILRARMLEDSDIWNASETHMEIDTALDAVKRHLSPDLRQVVLIHLSSGFSDENAFVKAVESLGVPCAAARKDMEIELQLYPF